MKNLILGVSIAIMGLFATAGTAEAGCCEKKCCKRICCKKVTKEVCRRYFCKTKCVCGCIKKIHYVEVTYCTTDCCGRSKTWKKVYRA